MGYNIAMTTTPNKSERSLKYKPDMIVYHIAEGTYEGTISWLKNPESGASSNFVVSRTGKITCLVPIDKEAWANGTQVSKASSKYYYKRATNKLVLERGGNANDYSVSIETEGFSSKTGGELTELQFNALVWLTQYIRKELKRLYNVDVPIDRDHLVGHYEIAPKEKPLCPGPKFQWNELIEAVKKLDDPTTDTTYPIPPVEEIEKIEEEVDQDLFRAGRKIVIDNVIVYPSSTSISGIKKSGTYYIYDGKEINGTYRITNGVSKVGKTPIGNYVSGYIKKLAVPRVDVDTDIIDVVVDVEPTNIYAVGRQLKLSNVSLYTSSTSTKSSKKLNGTYYIYDGKEIDGRYRITNDKSRVAQAPLGSNVTGYINKSSIK